MSNYEYTTNALVIRKEIDGLKILVTAEIPQHINPEDALDKVLDAMLDISDKMPVGS